MTAPLSPLPEEFSEQLRKQLRRLLVHFDEIRVLTPVAGTWTPPIDVRELDDAILIDVEVPGIPMEHLRVSIHDSSIRIEGRKERPSRHHDNDDDRPTGFICLERAYGHFARTVTLKWPIDIDGINAWLADGILSIRLPKAEACGQEIVIPITEGN